MTTVIELNKRRCPHLMYISEAGRLKGITRLYDESLKTFKSTVRLSRKDDFISVGINDKRLREALSSYKQMAYVDNLRICYGFELALKAILLEKHYIFHCIENKDAFYRIRNIVDRDKYLYLSQEQNERPIHKVELLDLNRGSIDGVSHNLLGLSINSIDLVTMLEKRLYRSVFNCKKEDIILMESFLDRRNKSRSQSFYNDNCDVDGIAETNDKLIAFIDTFVVPKKSHLDILRTSRQFNE